MAKAIKKFDKGGATSPKDKISRDLGYALSTFGVPSNVYKKASREAIKEGLNPVFNYDKFRDILIKYGAVDPPESINLMGGKA